jgi:glycosyltransferase involved in cell wall biosynthesis
VGGNPELVEEGVTGTLVPAGMHRAMADVLRTYVNDVALARRHGANARRRVEAHFSIATMVAGYLSVYDAVLAERTTRPAAEQSAGSSPLRIPPYQGGR